MVKVNRYPFHWWLFIVACFLFLSYRADEAAWADASVGLGGYVTTLPEVWGGGAFQSGPSDASGNPVVPRVSGDFSGPVQTSDWWTSLIWPFYSNNTHSEGLFPHPLTAKGVAGGLEVGYPTMINYDDNYHQRDHTWAVDRGYYYLHEENSQIDGGGVLVQSYHDLVAGVSGLNGPQATVAAYSDWLVTAEWQDGVRSMRLTLGHGLPFVYVTDVVGGNGQVTFSGTPTIWHDGGAVLGVTVNGNHYGVFGPTGSDWTGTAVLQSTLNGQDYYSVALLPDNSLTTLEFYRRRAYAYPTNSSVSWQYDEQTATVVTTFTVDTVLKDTADGTLLNQPLQALYHHQWDHTAVPMTAYSYQSPRGLMKVFDGSEFSTTMAFTGVLPSLPAVDRNGNSSYDVVRLQNYLTGVFDYYNGLYLGSDGLPPEQGAMDGDPNAYFPAGPDGSYNTYWDGKKLAAHAELVKIADELGYGYIKDEVLARMKDKLEDYLDGQGPTVLYYDENWDALIGYPAGFGTELSLNDPHFTWGYHIMAAATIARYDDTGWADASQWGGMIDLLVKNVANWERSDMQFPFLRNFDVYAGHSWASGPAMFDHGNNEESTSEAINFATALILWGTETGKTAIRDLGIYLYTHETTTVQQYWFDVDGDILPASLAQPYIPMLWGAGGHYDVWWPATIEELHGINFLPLNGGSFYLGHYPQNLAANIQYMHDYIADPSRINPAGYPELAQMEQIRWFEVTMTALALADGQAALAELDGHIANPVKYPGLNFGNQEFGASEAHTYHWVHTLAVLGNPDPTVTANVPTYAVFNKNGVKTYTAYNQSAAAIVVCFSDGATLSVPAGAVAHGDGNGPTCNVAPTNTPMPTATPCGSCATHTPTAVPPTGTPSPVPSATATTLPSPTLTHTPSGPYTYQVVEVDGATAVVQFIPTSMTQWVDVHYRVNNGPQLNYRMTDNGGTWEQVVSNLRSGDVLDFFFTYEVNTLAYDTPWYQHVFGGTAATATLIPVTATPVPPTATPTTGATATPTPLPTATASGPYSYGVTVLNSSQALIWFRPMSASAWVDVHYRVNSGPQLNYRMTNSAGTWEQLVSGLQSGDVLDFYFTYEVNMLAYDTPWYQHIFGGGAATVTPMPTATGVLPTPTATVVVLTPTATAVSGGCPAGAVVASPGIGCYTTILPAGETSVTYWPAVDDSSIYSAPMAKVTSNYSGPYQTNDWWSSLIWDWNQGGGAVAQPYSQIMHPHPFSMQAEPDGLRLTYAHELQDVDGMAPNGTQVGETNYLMAGDGAEHFHVTVGSLDAPDTRVDSYSDWVVTAQWDDGMYNMKATFGHGLPYVYFRKGSGGNFKVQFVAAPLNVTNNGEVFAFTASNNVGWRYALFGPAGSSWNWSQGGLEAELIMSANQDYLAVAALPTLDDSRLEFFRQHAYNFVTDSRADWGYDVHTQKVTTNFVFDDGG